MTHVFVILSCDNPSEFDSLLSGGSADKTGKTPNAGQHDDCTQFKQIRSLSNPSDLTLLRISNQKKQCETGLSSSKQSSQNYAILPFSQDPESTLGSGSCNSQLRHFLNRDMPGSCRPGGTVWHNRKAL